MPIHDRRIDLTQDRKFGRIRSPIISPILKDLKVFPWNSRRITSGDQLGEVSGKNRRIYGDRLSDEMCMLVRRTSNNTWFFGEPQRTKTYYFENLFIEVLSEIGLYNDCFVPCPSCGKKRLYHGFLYDTCFDCNMEQNLQKTKQKLFPQRINTTYIPWQDYTHRIQWDSQLQQFITSIQHPEQVLTSIRK